MPKFKIFNFKKGKITSESILHDKRLLDDILNEILNPTWESITPKMGTWEYLQATRLGKFVAVRGRASSYKYKNTSQADSLATLPEKYRPSQYIYSYGQISGRRYARVGISPAGDLFNDHCINISDATPYTTETWLNFYIVYIVDA